MNERLIKNAEIDRILENFSSWLPWEACKKNPKLQSPGIYLIRVSGDPAEKAPHLTPDTIYIGETCSQTVAARLSQFESSALRNVRAHSGGTTFANSKIEGEFYFSYFCPAITAEPMLAAYIRYVERALIFGYTERFSNQLPKCNSK